MKFSIITATFNREDTVAQAIASLQAQTFPDFEHLVQDGRSQDRTMEIVRTMADQRTSAVSEPDDGIYDALNRAMLRASGEIVGLLHSDDFYAAPGVLEAVAAAFADPAVDAVYGDLHYVARADPDRVVRVWTSGVFRQGALARGWMPPHPTLFVRRTLIERYGGYDTSFSIAADYDFILRYFGRPDFTAIHVPRVFTKMRLGGASNRSLGALLRKSREDLRAIRKNRAGGLGTLVRKNLSKIGQFR